MISLGVGPITNYATSGYKDLNYSICSYITQQAIV